MTDAQIVTGSTPALTKGALEDDAQSGIKWARDRRYIRHVLRALSLVGDLCIIFTAAIVTEHYYSQMGEFGNDPKLAYVVFPTFVLAAWRLGGYRSAVLPRASASVRRALTSLAAASGLSLFTALAFGVADDFLVADMLLFLGLSALGLVAFRSTVAAGLARHSEKTEPRVVLLGDESVRSNRDRKAAAIINVRAFNWRPLESDPNFLNELSLSVAGADRIVLSFLADTERQEWARLLGKIGLETELIEPSLIDLHPFGIRYFDSKPTLVVHKGPLTLRNRAMKRVFDLLLVLLAVPVVAPAVCLLAILIRLDSPGPAFFIQKRIGTNNRYFNCLKFRTMRTDLTDEAGKHLTARNDPRITRLGSFLRHTSLDELPQLWNVVKGEMSLVGPRPHALGASAEGALYWEAVPGYWQRHSVKPGLTGLAQIRGYRGPTEKRSELEGRVAADLEYIRTWSLLLDVKILLRTLRVLIHKNAF